MKQIHALVILLSISGALSLFEDFQLQPVYGLQDMHQIVKGDVDHVSVVTFWHDDVEQCAEIQEPILDLVDKMKGFFRFFSVDCSEIWENPANHQNFYMCNPKNLATTLPQISFFEPANGQINPTTQKPAFAQEIKYTGPLEVDSLVEFGQKLMPAYRNLLTTVEDLDQFLSFPNISTKAVLYTQKANSTSLFKAISAEFRGRIQFGEVVPPHDSALIEREQIDKFPSLVVYQQTIDGDEVHKIRYPGELSFQYLRAFFKKFASVEKFIERPEEVLPPPPNNDKNKTDDKSQKDNAQNKTNQDSKQNNTKSNTTEQSLNVEILPLNPYKHEKQILKEEMGILIHVHAKQLKHSNWEPLLKKIGKMFIYYDLVLDTDDKQNYATHTLGVSSYPSISFFPFGLSKKPTSQISFGKDKTLDELIQEISELVEDSTTIVSEQTLQTHIDGALKEGKLANILFHNKEELSLSYRAAALNPAYKNQFKFIHLKNPSQNVLKHFKITNIPKLITLFREVDPSKVHEDIKPEQVKLGQHYGHIVFNELAQYMDGFLENLEGKSNQKLIEITNQAEFNKLCRDQSSNCYIALLNGHPQERESEKIQDTRLQSQLQLLDKIKDKYGNKPITFGWIDAICHRNILPHVSLEEDSLPNFITIYNNKQTNKKQYSTMIGSFNQESLTHFIDKSLQGHVQLLDLNEDFEILNADCPEEHRLYQEKILKQENSKEEINPEDDEIMREIRQEERRKKEKAQEELNSQKKNQKDKKDKQKQNDL